MVAVSGGAPTKDPIRLPFFSGLLSPASVQSACRLGPSKVCGGIAFPHGAVAIRRRAVPIQGRSVGAGSEWGQSAFA